MFKVVNIDCSRRRKAFVFGSLLSFIVISLLPVSAGAQCNTGWNASGQWDFRQVGQKKPIRLSLEQKGQALTGTAVLPDGKITPGSTFKFGAVQNLSGTADGYITGDTFSLHIFWENGSTGVYNARIMPSGKVEGKGYEKGTPNILVSWDSVGRLNCPPPPPPAPKPIRSSGKPKVKPAPPQTSQPAPPPMKVPGIIASQVVFAVPSALTGFAGIQWDAGPDHPYAEVWLKVNNGDATFFVEQGKGGRQITVERGKVYEYILTDAGKTLATVTIVGQ